jgi:hypothetical protein
MTCGKCKHWPLKPDKNGVYRATRDAAFMCRAEIPMPEFPTSITMAHGFRWPPHRSYTISKDGEGCPFFVDRKASQ